MAEAADDTLKPPAGNVPNDGARILNPYRVAALNALDNAALTPFHIKVCLVAGVGFFTDAYDLFAINIVSVMIGYVYGSEADVNCRPSLNSNQDIGLKIAAPVGNLLGQLFFGWLADQVGRKRMYGAELIVMMVGTFAQATAADGQAINIIAMLIFWRFIVGLGVGGDYPLSATIAAEFSTTRHRGRMMTSVFSAQGGGNLVAALVAIIVTAAFKNAISKDFPTSTACTLMCDSSPRPLCGSATKLNHVDYLWRLILGIGCVPAAIALYFRLTVPETPRYTLDIERNVVQATEDVRAVRSDRSLVGMHERRPGVVQRVNAPRATTTDFVGYFGQSKNLRVLLGTMWSWFAIDVAFYTLGLNSSVILETVGFGASSDVYHTLKQICLGNIILSFAGLIPGYWICFYFIDRWGRKSIQYMGFAMLTVLFIIMGFSLNALIKFDNRGAPPPQIGPRPAFFFALLCFANLFSNFGANTTTFIIPAESFPTRYRATAHGIAAASGKLGAIVAQYLFSRLNKNGEEGKFLGHSFEILALFMLTGLVSTYFVKETAGKSLELLSDEDQDIFMQPPVHAARVEGGIILPMTAL